VAGGDTSKQQLLTTEDFSEILEITNVIAAPEAANKRKNTPRNPPSAGFFVPKIDTLYKRTC
jgi:hypothetical protein